MKNFFKKYWAELIAFGAIFGVLLICCIPDITWINTDCDGPHYIYSAKYLYPAHKTSAPLFLLLGNLFLRLPVGLEAWRFAMFSVLATMGTCIFVYLSIKWHTSNKWHLLAGVLIFGSSALVISQSTIIETYALVTMFGAAAYYFSLKRKWVLTALMLGAGGAVHHLIGIPILVLLVANKELRNWKYLGIMGSFLLFYLYIPITNRPPYMWQSANTELGASFLADNLSTMFMLWGGLSIWELPKRVLDAVGILGVSLGLASVLLLCIKWSKRNPLTWLFLLPAVYYATNLAPQTYVYMMPSIAAGAVIVGIGLSRMKRQWTWTVIGIAVIMLGFNANYFDVGRTLDSELSARKFWSEELSKVPDGHILLAQQGWEWAMVYPYNKDNDRNIIPICTGTLASKQYQNTLREWEIEFEVPEGKPTLVELQNCIIQSIADSNDNVWATFPSDIRTYGAIIEPIKYTVTKETEKWFPYTEGTSFFGNANYERLLNDLVVPQGITDGSRDMQWVFNSSNPYDIITGAIEVEEWIYIIFSNYTVSTFTMLGTIGAVPIWIGWMLFVRKKKWRLRWRNTTTELQ